jgi:hypothetical protein
MYSYVLQLYLNNCQLHTCASIVQCRLESAELEGLLAWRHERAQLIREDALKDVMSDFLSDTDDDVADNIADEIQSLEQDSTTHVSYVTITAVLQ